MAKRARYSKLFAGGAAAALVASGCVYTKDLTFQYDINIAVFYSALDLSEDGRLRLEAVQGDFVPGNLYLVDHADDSTVQVDITTAGAASEGGPILSAAMSSDGTRVAWVSAAIDLVPGDTNNRDDVFVRDLVAGTTIRVTGIGGAEPDGHARRVAMSHDGSTVVFSSEATNLVTGDTNASTDVFRYRIDTGTLELMSATPAGSSGSGASRSPSTNANGDVVAFQSLADDLVPGDTNGVNDVFVADATGVARWSVGPGGTQADAASFEPELSAAGSELAFRSDATNLSATTTSRSVWHATAPGVNQLVSLDTAGNPAPLPLPFLGVDISDDGNKVMFSSEIDPTVSGAVTVVHVVDEAQSYVASTDAVGTPVRGTGLLMSGDSRYVLFRGDTDFDGQSIIVPRTLKATFDAQIDSISVDTVAVGTSMPVTITGSGFFFDTSVSTSPAGGVTFTDVVVVDSSTLTATVNVSAGADLGERSVWVQLPGTFGPLTGTLSVPCINCLDVVAS